MSTATLLAITCILSGADDFPIKVYPCPRAETAPVIDGVLDDPAWSSVYRAGDFANHLTNDPPKASTHFRAVADDDHLYIAVECEVLAGHQAPVKFRPSTRDDWRAMFVTRPSIELFIEPNHDHFNYYQIAINVDATIYDGEGQNIAWHSKTKAAVTTGERAWIVEVAVPWRDLGAKNLRRGKIVGFNVCHGATWSRLTGGYHDPMRFGHLVLWPKEPQDLGQLVRDFRSADRSGPIRVGGSEDFRRGAYRSMAVHALRGFDTILSELDALVKELDTGPVAESIQRRIETDGQTVAPVRTKIDSGAELDEKTWSGAGEVVQKLVEELNDYIWQARLEALIARLAREGAT